MKKLCIQKFLRYNQPRCCGEMAEWSKAAVLKTVEAKTSGGSNPSLSAMIQRFILGR